LRRGVLQEEKRIDEDGALIHIHTIKTQHLNKPSKKPIIKTDPTDEIDEDAPENHCMCIVF
jgi:hypothetical protein